MPKENKTDISSLVWPEVPDPHDSEGNYVVTYDDETGLVSMPLDYWLDLVKYCSDAETNKAIIQELMKK